MKNMTSAVNVREMSMAAGMEDMVYKHVVVNGNKIVNNTDRDNVISFPGTDTQIKVYMIMIYVML